MIGRTNMSYTLYINKPNKRARLHDNDCERVHQHDDSDGDNGEYRYYNSYDKAWKKMNKLEMKGYECNNCYYCNGGE